MGRTKQAYIAATMGTDFTLYAVMRAMGLHITPEQEGFQRHLESIYPRVVEGTEEQRSINEDDPKEDR